MILLLDIGNSRLKWALAGGGPLDFRGTIAHDGDPSACVATLDAPPVEAVWVSHVFGAEQEAALAAAIAGAGGPAPNFARTRRAHAGLRIAYAEPERLGVDRWLAMLGLWSERRQAFAVVNAGTALTFDAVDADGQHLGGLIAPGLHTAEEAILSRVRFRVRPQMPRHGSGLGQDTESCVRQGAFHACVGLIERAGRLSSGARVISGGDADTLRPALDRSWEWRPHLVLEGLRALARGGEAG